MKRSLKLGGGATLLLVGAVAAAGCSGRPSPGTGTLSLSLQGDGNQVRLDSAPADSTYSATYPLANVKSMTVRVSRTGDLTARCQDESGTVACDDLPFFARVKKTSSGLPHVDVFDIYGATVISHDCDGSEGEGDGEGGGAATDAGTKPPKTDGSCTDGCGGDGRGDGTGGGTGSGTSGHDCNVSVSSDCESCTMTINGTKCDCSDVACVRKAAEGCTGGSSSGGSGGHCDGSCDNNGGSGGGTGTGGGGGAGKCDDASIAKVRAQFCADIDAWLKAHNIDYKIDCTKIGDDYDFSKAKAPKDHTNYRCREIIHDGWVKVRAALGTCDTDSYINWESSSRFELKEAGACRGSPLVLDLDGNGVNLTSLEDGVAFDLLGTGERVRTAWIDRGDALLTYDWNGNGVIDGAAELFGNASNGGEYDDGFAALAELDSNGDGRVDAKDAAFAGLRVWRDANHDGVSAPGELTALHDVGIRSLTVAARKGVDSFDAHGNDLSLASDFVREDGTRGVVVDAYLRFKP